MLIDQAFGLSVATVPFQTGTFAQRAAHPLKGAVLAQAANPRCRIGFAQGVSVNSGKLLPPHAGSNRSGYGREVGSMVVAASGADRPS
ncbi:hypothetical protein [Aminobacter ciceronei]|uniref:Uncharacterized protein n=1 Tax=Aminobacter ciceronei TaxID=150723 RepID=A0ABR6CCS1_9HYPH|nr:hypothetical protein [Aminobacter ciceronei]MBA8908830.1 hypothetical protein [Aminobacter ciceronei]MBA9022691.1 hypothetical protein [Aminobacter ciceronei]